jgi:hypothetical protein
LGGINKVVMIFQIEGSVMDSRSILCNRIFGTVVLSIVCQYTLSRAATIPYFPVDTTCAEYTRFVTYVDRALAGNPDYGYSPSDAMIRYSMCGNTKYADFAIKQVDTTVASEEAAIAAGQTPDIAGDSYLYVGEQIASLSLTYDWAFSRLTESQKTRWKAYADQAIYNVWNPSQAKWGSASKPWSGWSINDPGNNYHYSFLRATMYWATASQNQQWLDFVKQQKAPPLCAYFAKLPGGGSLEGTGYGTSHKNLFINYYFWKSVTGTDLSAQSTHCTNSIDYWIHATVPTLQWFAPIGDQARVSDAPLYDYQRGLVVWAVLLNPGTPQAGRGLWWLNNISIRRMSGTFNLKDNMFKLPDTPQKPTALSYYSAGVGDLFVRTSWDTTATWLHVKAGLYNQSHAHQDQGSFSLYNKSWLAVTENIHTHSGIEQGSEVHNVLLFKNATDTISQEQSDSASTLIFEDDGATLSAKADLSIMYRKGAKVKAWRRSVLFDRPANTVTVCDTFSVQAGINAVWQLNTPVQPVQQGDSIVAGALIVTPLDTDAQVKISEWNKIHSDASWTSEYLSGWKIELTRPSPATTFNVKLRVNAASTWKPAEIRQKAGSTSKTAKIWLESGTLKGGKSIFIHVTVPKAQVLSLKLYDCLGRKAGAPLMRTVTAGSHNILWRVPTLGTGTYFAVVSGNGIYTIARLPMTR